jgi:hypothetical protein
MSKDFLSKDFFVHLFHLIIIGGFFLYVGIMRTDIPDFLYNVILGTSGIVLFYHLFRAYQKIMADHVPWVSLIHILIVAPVLFLIGWNREKTPRYYFEILLMLGFATIGYHGYYLVNSGH